MGKDKRLKDTAGRWKSRHFVLIFPFQRFQTSNHVFFQGPVVSSYFHFEHNCLTVMQQMVKQCYFQGKYIKFYARFLSYPRIGFWRHEFNTVQWLSPTGRHCLISKIHICPPILFIYLVVQLDINHMHYLDFLYGAA